MTAEPLNTTPAVLGRCDDRLGIWHVHTGPGLGLSRLTGAWLLDDERVTEIRGLVHGHPVAVASADTAVPGYVTPALIVDTDATVRAVEDLVTEADRRFAEHRAATRHRLISPRWPPIEHPGTARIPETTPEPIATLLRLARGYAELADRWAEFEKLRLSRKPLIPLGGELPRPLPLKAVR